MSELSTHDSLTLTAYFRDEAAAERAVGRLRSAGVPESSVDIRRADATDRGWGRLGFGLTEFLMPAADRDSYARGMQQGGVVVVASDVPHDLSRQALDILDAEADDVDESHERTSDSDDFDSEGAQGTMGGQGRATSDIDRLTGAQIGSGTLDPREQGGWEGLGGAGSATGEVDRLTGERIGGPRIGRRFDSPGHTRARAYVRDPESPA